MAQIDNSDILAKIQQAMVKVPMVGGGKKESLMGDKESFQKLLDQKTQSAKPEQSTQPKTETAEKPQEKPEGAETELEEEDPVEMAKRAALTVTLAPLTPEELSQFADQYLPQTEEGEGVVCVGVTTGPNGESVPILMGEKDAAAQYGTAIYTQTVQPQQAEAAQGEVLPQTVAQPQTQAQTEQVQADQSPTEAIPAAQAPQAEVKAEVQTDAGAQPQTQEGEETVQVTQADSQPQALFHDVKAAPIKVGEAPVLEETPSVENQVNTQVLQALDQGQSKVTIQLTPNNLGQVTVEITRAEDGSLHVALSAESTQTRGLLEKHASNLQELLASRQQETVQVQVQRQEESQRQQQHGYEGREGRNGQQQEQEQRRERHPQQDQDFMQQLRLGLIPVDGDID
ncbi:MAG: flagellar hook-length control protein FliK [Lawsonibacter sp.]|nr:flagellar hook-length control protein FliK [Lawsonibacter sp.]